MSGQVASGKSTLARALADALAAPRVEADRVRDQLLHGAAGEAERSEEAALGRTGIVAMGGGRPEAHEAFWARSFVPGFSERVYAELLRRAEAALASGRSVVVDACFPSRRERDAVRALAARHGAALRLIECSVDAETQAARLAARDAEEEGDPWQVLAGEFAQRWSRPDEVPERERLRVDARRPVDALRQEALAWLGTGAEDGGAGKAREAGR